jgi:5-methylcytosine-specific restriction protein A
MIIFRYLTHADFFNINKPPGSEELGGGQSYIDFSTQRVEKGDWAGLLAGVKGVTERSERNGPRWEFPVFSIGSPSSAQTATVFQRRPTTIVIARQKLDTRDSNRIVAWSPAKGFPIPADRNSRRECPDALVVFFARIRGRVWAGWFINQSQADQPKLCSEIQKIIGKAIMPVPGLADRQREGCLKSNSLILRLGEFLDHAGAGVFAGEAEPADKQAFVYQESTHNSLIRAQQQLEEDVDDSVTPSYSLVAIRKRNLKAVQNLKNLYGNCCQLTGTKYVFPKKDGQGYTEVHHLIPLGQGGADSPSNMVVLSAQMHRMMHYADVSAIDLTKMKKTTDGGWTLEIKINGQDFTMRWNPAHGRVVSESQ